MQDHLGVGGRLHHGAVAHQLAAQRQPVGEIAVVADREAAGIEFGEQRLHVAQDGRAGRGVADMADGDVAGQALDHLAAGEGVADEAEPAFGVEAAAVEGDDAGGFLAAMLQGVQSERGDGGGLGVAEDAEHAAFLAQRVAFEIVLQFDPAGRSFRSSWSAGSEGFCISSIRLSFGLELACRGFLDQLFKAVAGRFTVAITGRRGCLLGVSLIVFWFILLESL